MKKEIIKFTIVFFTLIAIFFTYSVLVCLLPTKNIKKNVTKSVPAMVMEDGENYPYAIIHKQECKMDNFTDAIILSQNFTIDNSHPVQSAMYAKTSMQGGGNLVEALKKQTDLEEVHIVEYARYWFGGTFLLRPFLLFTNYTIIRWMLYAVSSILLLILGIKLFQTTGVRKTIAFFLGLLFVNFYVTQFSMQFFSVSALAIVACILMCNHFKDRKKIILLSFIIGCITSYLDLLTTPILTCGLPLVVYLSAEKEGTFKERLSTIFFFVFLWGLGYALTWSSKWVLGTFLTDVNVFKSAFDTIFFRTSIETNTRLDAIISNYNLLPAFFIYLILLLMLPFVILFFNKREIKTNFLLLIVATFPYLWYLVLAQHTWWHWWFTYRMQAISLAALFIIFVNFISWDKMNLFFNKRKNRKSVVISIFLIPIFVFLFSSCCKNCEPCVNKKPDYTDFFIAHAGGAIDGITYTNSLEAMNLSYSKGCRLFELDLRETTDGKLVATHDGINVTETEFMNTFIHGKYTPMNMDAINNWFQEHLDAILITDKLNDPRRIYDEFQFRDRVVMELFTWDAVDKAIVLGIKPMVSENLVFGYSKKAMELGIPFSPIKNISEVEQILEEKKIKHICMNRICLLGREFFLKRVKEKGIKNYVYFLGSPLVYGQPAEQYIWNYDMKMCYGMYADDLDLLYSLLNGEASKNIKVKVMVN
jgi:hypothetical protein